MTLRIPAPASRTRALRRAGGAAVAVAAVTGLLASPAAATPADPQPGIGIGAVHTAAARDSLSVPVWTDTPAAHITTVDATLSFDGHVVDLVLGDPDGDGRYSPAGPIVLGDTLPTLGHWAVSVAADDSSGASATRADAGVFDFTDRLVDNTFVVQATIGSHVHPDPTVSGTVLAFAPGTGTSVPLANRTVTVSHAATDTVPAATRTATTDGDGHFTTAAFPDGGGLSYTATVTADDDEVDGTASTTFEAGYLGTDVTVTATSDHARVSDGQAFTVSGTVTDAFTHAAEPGVAVRVRNTTSLGPGVLVTTDAAGRFSAPLTGIASSYFGDSWSAVVLDHYLTGSASGSVSVPRAATFYGTRITLASTGRVTATGTIGLTYAGDASVTYSEVTYLEYSPNGSTGWKALGHVTSAGGLGETFSVSGWGYVDGFYRLRHAQSDELEAATTTPVRRSRIDTYVFGTKASPTTVTKGRTVSVSGTLEQNVRGWHPMARTTIYLYFLPKGAKTYRYVATGRTDTHGHITLRGTASATGYWQLHYFGDGTHFDSGDTDAYVRVR